MVKCERCRKRVRNRDQYLLLGYNGDLCSDCFEGLIVALEIARSETIKIYLKSKKQPANKPIKIEL